MARRLLAALTLAWAVVWVERAALSPVGPLVQADLAIDYAALGFLSTLAVLAGAIGYIAAGWTTARHARATLLGGLALLGVATLAAGLSRTYMELAVSQALAGLGEGLFYVPALALVTRAYEGPRLGRSLGTLDAGISIGSFAVLLAAAPIATLLGWRAVLLAGAVLGLLLVPLLAMGVRAPPREVRPRFKEVLHRRAAPVYAAIMLLLFVYLALLYLSPAFLVTRGFSVAEASLVMAASVGLGIPWHFIGGDLADRLGPARSALAFNLLFAAGLLALSMVNGAWPSGLLLIASYSVGIAGFTGIIVLVPRALGAHLAAPAFGVFWALGYLGGAAGPFVFGALADMAGFGTALLALAGIATAGALVLLPLVRTRPRPLPGG